MMMMMMRFLFKIKNKEIYCTGGLLLDRRLFLDNLNFEVK